VGKARATLVHVDITGLIAAGSLLYGGAFIARGTPLSAPSSTTSGDVDPTVRTLVSGGRHLTAAQWVADTEKLETYALSARAILTDCDALVLPTVSNSQPFAAVAADPIGVKRHPRGVHELLQPPRSRGRRGTGRGGRWRLLRHFDRGACLP